MHKSIYTVFNYADGRAVISEVSRMLTHLLTDDLVVETQIAGGGSADLSSSIWAKEKDGSKWLAMSAGMTEGHYSFHSWILNFFLPFENTIQYNVS